MIVEAVMIAFIELFMGLLNVIFGVLGNPVAATVSIPRPLWDLVNTALSQFYAVFTALTVWWIWRQVKS